ncbi:MAG TPA: aldehyde dehydrogenase, partial [Planctomycetota bacterium]|nr:aldehyde dehydrogenase [Planctomycetota bacterium]
VLPLSSKERGPGGEVGEGCWKPRKKISPDEPIKSKWSSRRQSGEAATEVPTTNPQSAIRNPQSEAVPRHPSPVTRHNTGGVYDDVNAAVEAAQRAQNELSKLGFSRRFCIVEAMRKAALENLERWSHEAVAETKMGRAEDKMKKNRLVTLKTPGPEILQQPEAFSGTYGLTTIRLDPFGVIASIIPCTNSTETVINNGIGMISAGNAVVFNPHPIAKNVSADCVRTLNAAIAAAGGPSELLCCIADPTIESANALMAHPLTPLVVVTGGGAVVEAAMKSGKRAICAGPGNPPAVVDETADLAHAAKAIVRGASLDNNVVCTDEKAVLAVDSIADELKALMLKENCIELKGVDIERLTKLVLVEATPHANSQSEIRNPKSNFAPNKKLVGKNASHILRELGITADESVRLVLVDVDKDHPLIHAEQLMPVLPLCRLKDADAATAHAAAVEAGRRHTASIHSQRTDRITQFVNTMNVSICVANDANYAGLGLGGEGYTSFSIATPTGEGMTTARNFCRERRMAICGGGLSRK